MTNNPREILDREVGGLLVRLAATVQAEMMRKVSQSAGPKRVKRKRGKGSYTVYTTPSKPGEYLRTRTGNLRAHVRYEPTDALAAGRKGVVRIGYGKGAWYGGFWETRKDAQRRKGLIDLVAEMAPQLAAVAVSTRAR